MLKKTLVSTLVLLTISLTARADFVPTPYTPAPNPVMPNYQGIYDPIVNQLITLNQSVIASQNATIASNQSTSNAIIAANAQEATTIGNSIDLLVNGYGQSTIKQYLWTPPYDITAVENASGIRQTLGQVPFKQAESSMQQAVIDTLTMTDTDTAIKKVMKNIPAPYFPITTKPGSQPTQTQTQEMAANQQASVNFDPNNLLGRLQYDVGASTQKANAPGPQQQAAENFITMVSGQAYPMKVVDISKLANVNIAYDNSDIASYLVQLRTYAAQQAMGLSNLYRLYAERLPNSNNTQQEIQQLLPPQPSGSPIPNYVPPTLPNNPSDLQVRHFLATRRVDDANWVQTMGAASPAEVDRQTLFLLAEMRAEMFTQEMELEKLNATMSVLVLQNTMAQSILLQQSGQKAQQILSSMESSGSKTQTFRTATPVYTPPKAPPTPPTTPPQQPR